MPAAGRKQVVVAVVSLAVIAGAVGWMLRSAFSRPSHAPVVQHVWACSKCGHQFRAALPKRAEPLEAGPMGLVELLGGAAKCAECGGASYCRPLVRCRTCGASFAATIALDPTTGRPIPLRCVNGGCSRPLLAGRPLPEGAEAKGKGLKCGRCGRTFVVVEMGNVKEVSLTCPYADHAPAAVRAVE